MEKKITDLYGGQVRVRVCGLWWKDDTLLMVKHRSLKPDGFWSPPGGGIEFSESINETLKREFLEETSLLVSPGKFKFGCEFIQSPLHAIELFYQIDHAGGLLNTGYDPEIQLIEDVKYLSTTEMKAIPRDNLHGIFHQYQNKTEIEKLSGFYRI
ncbi:MAG TPA: NUDIX hydrolase [Chryseolinea sp.]|nr:NUDIX hydrolase [Chryseolinea sp.]